MVNSLNNIRIARKAKNMSIVSLAKQSGLSVSSISAYENNKRQPKIESLQKISKVLGVSSAYLNGMSGEKNILNVNSQNPKNNTIDIDVIGFLLNARSTHPGKVPIFIQDALAGAPIYIDDNGNKLDAEKRKLLITFLQTLLN